MDVNTVTTMMVITPHKDPNVPFDLRDSRRRFGDLEKVVWLFKASLYSQVIWSCMLPAGQFLSIGRNWKCGLWRHQLDTLFAVSFVIKLLAQE